MRLKNYSSLLFGFVLLGYSCISPPENFPSTPEIEFSSLEYVGTPGQDSLLLTLSFKDAEGDLGLSATDINPLSTRSFTKKMPLETLLPTPEGQLPLQNTILLIG